MALHVIGVYMSAIAARLSDALGETGSLPWIKVAPDQQQQIMAAIATDHPPAAIAFPQTTAELSKVMALAAENGWRSLPMGQGSKLSWGGLAQQIDLVISTARLNRVVEHAVGDYTVTVEPGLKVAELKQLLAEQKQFLAIDPAFANQATVGGVVATADTGSLRQRYGGLRDMLIGVQFARYDGKLARAGGRVVKNVAGYDLMKLMTGAYGSLGILSELTFRLYPVQAESRSLILSGETAAIEQAAAAIRLSGLTPVALDILSASLMDSLDRETSLSLVARFQGIPAGVEEQIERLQKIATDHSLTCQSLDGEADQDFWQQLGDVLQSGTLICKVGLRPSAISAMLKLLGTVMPSALAKLQVSSGLGWVQLESVNETTDELVNGLEKLRSHCQINGGFLTLLQAPKALKQKIEIWGYSGNASGVMSALKQKFDPHRLLSSGRFVGGL
ncbi:MAG: FAD-binding oxidoreductase [Phormidesmis sp.]